MKRVVWNISKRFLVIVPFVAMFLYMYGQLITGEQTNARENIVSEHTGHLVLMDYLIENAFDEYYSTLYLVKNSNEVTQYFINPSSQTHREVELFFERIAENRPYVQNLNMLSSTGELLVSLHTLQTSSDSTSAQSNSLITSMKNMNAQDLYFSPLHDTHNIITGIPVIDNQGEFIAAFTMEVDRRHVLTLVNQFFVNHSNEVTFFLLDSTGQVLLTFESGVEFSNLTSPVIQNDLALVSARALEESQGTFTHDGMNYHYLAFNPFEEYSPFYAMNRNFLLGIVVFSDADIVGATDSFLLRNEELRWILAFVILLLGGSFNLLAYFRRNDKELLTVSNLVSDQSHDGVVITNPGGQVTYCNKTFELLTGFSNQQVKLESFEAFHLDGSSFKTEEIFLQRQNHNQSNDLWRGFVWLKGKFHYALTHLLINNIVDNRGHEVHTVRLFSNPRNLTREFSYSLLDTQQPDYGPHEVFPLTLVEQKRSTGTDFLLVYLQLANLDIVEAQYSLDEHYLLGARIRETIANFLGEGQLLIQYSPNTYILTIPIQEDSPSIILSLLQKNLKKPIRATQKDVLHIRCGVSLPSSMNDTAELMIWQSRMALAAQEHFDEDGILQYDAHVNTQLARYYSILQSFPIALEEGQININYQPVVDCETKKIRGAEALVRWKHPALGMISPNEFIPIIEQNNLERLLGRYVVEQTALFMKKIVDRFTDGDFSISINLCPTELQDTDLVEHMVRTLDAYQIPHHILTIELTERTLLTDMDAANRVLKLLHDNNIRVAIDDFGTGFSSLSYLHELDVDLLKIDRSFIKQYPQEDDGVILKAMVGMAKELDIPVLVEGIETDEQLNFIESLAVESYQGFLFSGAVSPQEFVLMLHVN